MFVGSSMTCDHLLGAAASHPSVLSGIRQAYFFVLEQESSSTEKYVESWIVYNVEG